MTEGEKNPNKQFEPFRMEGGGSRFMRKARDNPFLTAGIFGGMSVAAWMMWGLKHRPKDQKLSVYLIHTRLGVQSAVVGCLTMAMAYNIFKDQVQPRYQHYKEEHNGNNGDKK